MKRIACAAISGRIYLGNVNKTGADFTGGKQDVTSDCLKAVIDKIGVGGTHQITRNGKPFIEITIRQIEGHHEVKP